MKHLLTILICFSLQLIFAQSKTEKVDSLLTISKFDSTVGFIYDLAKRGYPTITNEAWSEILGNSEEVIQTIRVEVIKQYSNELTLEEINQLLDFYNSKLGKKLLQTNNIITAKLKTWGERWGNQKVNDFFDYIKKQQNDLLLSGGCEYLKEGKFYYLDPIKQDTVHVIREKNNQKEFMDEGVGEYSITWEDDCTYILKCEKYIDETFNYMLGLETKVKLIEKNGFTSKFLATNTESEYIHVSFLYEKQ